MSLNVQFYLLVHTILYGIFLGLTFDSLNLIILQIKKKYLADGLTILFWICQLLLAIWYFHRINHGKFQTYLLIFVLFGGLIYYKLLQKKYQQDVKILLKHVKLMLKVIKKAINVLFLLPLLFIFKTGFDIMVLPKRILVHWWYKIVIVQDEKEYAKADDRAKVACD